MKNYIAFLLVFVFPLVIAASCDNEDPNARRIKVTTKGIE